jgi:hypothetical protein
VRELDVWEGKRVDWLFEYEYDNFDFCELKVIIESNETSWMLFGRGAAGRVIIRNTQDSLLYLLSTLSVWRTLIPELKNAKTKGNQFYKCKSYQNIFRGEAKAQGYQELRNCLQISQARIPTMEQDDARYARLPPVFRVYSANRRE